MARINKKALIDKVTGGDAKKRYVYETVIEAFIAAIQDEVKKGNVVAYRGLGTFYIDTKRKREGLAISQASPHLLNTSYVYIDRRENLGYESIKTLEALNWSGMPIDITNYKKVVYVPSPKLLSEIPQTHTIRFKYKLPRPRPFYQGSWGVHQNQYDGAYYWLPPSER